MNQGANSKCSFWCQSPFLPLDKRLVCNDYHFGVRCKKRVSIPIYAGFWPCKKSTNTCSVLLIKHASKHIVNRAFSFIQSLSVFNVEQQKHSGVSSTARVKISIFPVPKCLKWQRFKPFHALRFTYLNCRLLLFSAPWKTQPFELCTLCGRSFHDFMHIFEETPSMNQSLSWCRDVLLLLDSEGPAELGLCATLPAGWILVRKVSWWIKVHPVIKVHVAISDINGYQPHSPFPHTVETRCRLPCGKIGQAMTSSGVQIRSEAEAGAAGRSDFYITSFWITKFCRLVAPLIAVLLVWKRILASAWCLPILIACETQRLMHSPSVKQQRDNEIIQDLTIKERLDK